MKKLSSFDIEDAEELEENAEEDEYEALGAELGNMLRNILNDGDNADSSHNNGSGDADLTSMLSGLTWITKENGDILPIWLPSKEEIARHKRSDQKPTAYRSRNRNILLKAQILTFLL